MCTPIYCPLLPTTHLHATSLNDATTPSIYTLSLHDALPISDLPLWQGTHDFTPRAVSRAGAVPQGYLTYYRSEEHTSELQSHVNLVCRLLLEKKKFYEYGRVQVARLHFCVHNSGYRGRARPS